MKSACNDEQYRKISPLWREIFAAAQAHGGALERSAFSALCLYHGKYGYYSSERRRVGKDGADFYTAVSLKRKIFPRLLRTAVETYLSARGQATKDFPIVEIGAERGAGMFGDSTVFSLGDKIELPPQCVAVSNELLDARPADRYRFENGIWKKSFLKISENDGAYCADEFFSDASDSENAFLDRYYFRARVEGFSIDISADARTLFDSICSQIERGALFFADYYRSADELCLLPYGTSRTYRRHSDGTDISEFAGETDITFSPCFEEFADIARARGFAEPALEEQGKFFISRAAAEVERIISSSDPFDADKRELAELVSPVHMGAAFGIFSASKNINCNSRW